MIITLFLCFLFAVVLIELDYAEIYLSILNSVK